MLIGMIQVFKLADQIMSPHPHCLERQISWLIETQKLASVILIFIGPNFLIYIHLNYFFKYLK